MNRSRHLVMPEALGVIDAYGDALNASDIDGLRASLAAMMATMPAPQEDSVGVEDITVAGSPGDAPLRILVYTPINAHASLPVRLDIHSGRFVSGSADSDMRLRRMLAAAVRCAVVSVDYRLASEACFPASLNDSEAAVRWITEQSDDRGYDLARFTIGGRCGGRLCRDASDCSNLARQSSAARIAGDD